MSAWTTANVTPRPLTYPSLTPTPPPPPPPKKGGKGFGDPVTFDNAYYTGLLAKPWAEPNNPMADHVGLPSDHALPEDPDCLVIIEEYAADNEAFKRDFAAAYQKLACTGAVFREA
jgi:L-ascorbate peroxidase